MIYFDHAATSYPKLPSVLMAHRRATVCYGANPGRGGYPMAMASTQQLYLCRERAAVLFGLPDPRRVVLMPGCTMALNTVIKSLLANGGRAVISGLEHNAVVRPLHALSPFCPCYDIVPVEADDDATVQAFRRAITPRTKVIVCSWASNVTGVVLPVARLAALAHEHGIPIVVDGAQGAGHLPINMEQDGIDYLCVAGHKGLLGTMGTGMLLCRDDQTLRPLVEGGTGSYSLSREQPADLPERLESGTPNVAGICALRAGMEHLLAVGLERVAAYEHALSNTLYEGLQITPRVRLCSPPPRIGHTVPVISFTVEGTDPQEIGDRLAQVGVAVRCGLHCAPLAHQSLGTLPSGTVRCSLGITNTVAQINTMLKLLKKIL